MDSDNLASAEILAEPDAGERNRFTGNVRLAIERSSAYSGYRLEASQ